MLRISVLLLMSCYLVCAAPAQTQMKMEVGKLHISSVPEGCAVLLDNRLAGTTPALLDSIPEGAHVVVVRKEGFCTVVDTIAVEVGALKDHAVALEPECFLSVESEPSDAAVYLNGVFQGKTPTRIGQLTSGKHTVKLMRRDFEGWADTVQLAVGSPARMRAVLKSAPAFISVLTPDSSVEVFVNDISVGFGSKQQFTIPAGFLFLKARRTPTGEIVEGHYFMRPTAVRTFRTDFNRLSHTAFGYSLLFPGLGQFLDGSRAKGVAFAAGFIAAIANAVAKQGVVRSKNDDLLKAMNRYYPSFWTAEILGLRSSALSLYNEARVSARARNVSIGVAAGVYLLSALDAWFSHDTVSEIATDDDIEFSALNDGTMLSGPGITITMKVPL